MGLESLWAPPHQEKAKTPISYSYYNFLSLQLWPNTPITNLEVTDSVSNSKFIP